VSLVKVSYCAVLHAALSACPQILLYVCREPFKIIGGLRCFVSCEQDVSKNTGVPQLNWETFNMIFLQVEASDTSLGQALERLPDCTSMDGTR